MQLETHETAELREKFQEWLDSYQPDRLKEIDVAPVAWLLECLADCGDTLPADYCDQLDIPKGSTYAQAVADLRQLYGRLRAKDGDEFIGHDTWWIDGMPVTPGMRRDVLESVAELFLAHGEEHREWFPYDDGPGGAVVETDTVPQHHLMSDFLDELTGESDANNRSWLLSYHDDLYVWMHDEFLVEAWHGSYEKMLERNEDFEGEYHAAGKTIEWLDNLACQDVVNWYKATTQPEE